MESEEWRREGVRDGGLEGRREVRREGGRGTRAKPGNQLVTSYITNLI